jgi:hypothetical protein
MSRLFVGMSADGRMLVRCGDADRCAIVEIATGQTRRTVAAKRPDGIDGTPISEDPAIAPVLNGLGVGKQGTWPYRDVTLAWREAPNQGLAASLVDTTTKRELPIVHLDAPGVLVVPLAPVLSADTKALAVTYRAMIAPQQFASDDAVVVPVHRAVAALYASGGRHEGARVACGRAGDDTK